MHFGTCSKKTKRYDIGPCDAWITWPEVFGIEDEDKSYYFAFGMYTFFGVSK